MTAYPTASGDPTDVMGRRIGAYLIDGLLALVIVMAIAIPVFTSLADKVPTAGRSDFCNSYNDEHSGGICVAANDTAYVLTPAETGRLARTFYGAAIGWMLLNAVLLQGLAGGTIGKLLVGLRVVRSDGRRAGIGWCALRTIVLVFVDALCFIIGLVVSLSSTGHRRVGDMAASTFVVPKVYEGQPLGVPGFVGSSSTPPGYAAPPTFSGGIGGSGGGPPTSEGPTWDPARGAYIQYDRAQSAWLQWDDDMKAWNPIDS